MTTRSGGPVVRAGAALIAVLVGGALLAGCTSPTETDPPPTDPATTGSDPAATSSDASPTPDRAGTVEIDLDGRPFRLHVPPDLDPATAVPLVVGLHGYTSSSAELDSYFGLSAEADARGFLLALPEGTTDPAGDQFWNAVEGGCCDFHRSGTDDVGYLDRLVETVSASYAVGPVVLVGHSNGGYLAHRFACEHADRVSAIATLAGTLPPATARCAPSGPVTVVHVHGDADDVVPYGGGRDGASAAGTAAAWADRNGCAPTPESAPALDLDWVIPGAETTVERYADGCLRTVELWTIVGGGHVPDLGPAFTPAVLDVLLGG